MLNKIFNGTKLMEKSLDAAWLRNEVIAQNVSNVDTPGYKRKNVAFEEYLDEAANGGGLKGRRTDSRHISIGGSNLENIDIKVSQDNANLNTRLDGNNVDIEREMSLMAKNTIKYNTLIQKINGHFSKLKSVINEGR